MWLQEDHEFRLQEATTVRNDQNCLQVVDFDIFRVSLVEL